MLRVCSCGRHVRAVDPTCPFCGVRTPGGAESRVTRRSRAAVFASVGLASVACGARTDLGGVVRADASEIEDAGTTDATACVAEGASCTESSQCCPSMMCETGQCGYVVFYGGPFRDE